MGNTRKGGVGMAEGNVAVPCMSRHQHVLPQALLNRNPTQVWHTVMNNVRMAVYTGKKEGHHAKMPINARHAVREGMWRRAK